MINMDSVTKEFIAARPLYRTLSPGPSALLTGRLVALAKTAAVTAGAANQLRKGADPAEMLGDVIGGRITKLMGRPVKRRVTKAHLHMRNVNHDPLRKNGMGGRSWITKPGRHEMVIVFHDANRAGPHIDVHIGRLSMVYRVKPDLYARLKYNNSGMLTEDSKKAIINHVRTETRNGSRVPQNLDHSLSNARAAWTNGDPDAKTYGSGRTRQVVSVSTVDVYKAHPDGPIEMYAPLLNPHRGMYIYKIHPGDNKRAPILIWGNKSAAPPKLEDRLHLKLVHPEEMEKAAEKVDMDTSTAKYDGSSCYVHIGPKGTTVWSPRLSSATGERIEYTFKLDGLANVRSDENIVAMGELLFREKGKFPWSPSKTYLPSAVGSGILNSNSVLPKNIKPEIRLYRVDRIGRENTKNLGFWENRSLQVAVAATAPQHLKVVSLMTPEEAAEQGYEGIVAVPEGASVNDGIKVKWWMDPHDWVIDKVDFKPGDRGGIAGVVRATSLESGKKFNLGPGQMGNRELTERMMNNPEHYEGAVLKVNSRHGHEGRASKVVAFHDDKGVAVVTS